MLIKIKPNITITSDKNGNIVITQSNSDWGKNVSNSIVLKREEIEMFVDTLKKIKSDIWKGGW